MAAAVVNLDEVEAPVAEVEPRVLTHVTASHPTPYGPVRSEWRREGDKLTWKVAIPPNTTATLRLPDGTLLERGSGEHVVKARL